MGKGSVTRNIAEGSSGREIEEQVDLNPRRRYHPNEEQHEVLMWVNDQWDPLLFNPEIFSLSIHEKNRIIPAPRLSFYDKKVIDGNFIDRRIPNPSTEINESSCFPGLMVLSEASYEDLQRLVAHISHFPDQGIRFLLDLSVASLVDGVKNEITYQHLIELGLLDALRGVLSVNADRKVALEACWLVSTIMTGAGIGMMKALVEKGIIQSIWNIPRRGNEPLLIAVASVLSKTVSFIMVAQERELMSVMFKEKWVRTLFYLSINSSVEIQLVLLHGFWKVLENYHPEVSNLAIDDTVKRFDPVEVGEEVCKPRDILWAVLLICEAVQNLCHSTFKSVSCSATHCLEHFWMRHRLCKQHGMKYI